MTSDKFRELALSMQGAVERSHMGHPDFRANGRIFATLRGKDPLGMVKVTPDEQRALMRASPGTFRPSPGAWGRSGCTDVKLSAADTASVRGAIVLAWELVHATPQRKPARSKKTRARAPKKKR
jgi:hypothetical protein